MNVNADSPVLLVLGASPSPFLEISNMLNEKDYSCVNCGDADEGMSVITVLGENHFDAVVVCMDSPSALNMAMLDAMREAGYNIPVIIIGSNVSVDMTVSAFRRGAFDFIVMPSSHDLLARSIGRAVSIRRQREREKQYILEIERKLSMGMDGNIHKADMEIIMKLAAVAEFRDPAEVAHNCRIAEYCEVIAKALSLPDAMVEAIKTGGQLHDIGKSCMPDSILLKKGPLTKVETDIMKRHTVIGKQILEGSESSLMATAAAIAVAHHERFDGSGYPDGLKGEAIPMEGRIAAISDQYDSLRIARPYKSSMSHAEAVQIIMKGDGRTMPVHFDPVILDAFKDAAATFESIFERYGASD